MKVDITRLKSGIDPVLDIHLTKEFSKEELSGTDLLELKNVVVSGVISKNALASYDLDLLVEGTTVRPCAVTLKPVSRSFSIPINGNYEEILEEMNEFWKKDENTIDLLPIVWENILMEIPMREVSEDASLETKSGEGWRLITEETDSDHVNPELQKLSTLLEEK